MAPIDGEIFGPLTVVLLPPGRWRRVASEESAVGSTRIPKISQAKMLSGSFPSWFLPMFTSK
jgi:hypothetical protein